MILWVMIQTTVCDIQEHILVSMIKVWAIYHKSDRFKKKLPNYFIVRHFHLISIKRSDIQAELAINILKPTNKPW